MKVEHLSLTNYRNYARMELDLPGDTVVLQGDNAQGKTNFLEAIHVLATTRSPRASSDRDMINWLAFKEALPFARVVGRVRRSNGISQVELTIAPRETDAGLAKRFKVNGVPKRAIDVIGVLTVVLFSPLDVELVSGSPSQRRRFLDIMNSQVNQKYLRGLQQFNKVLAQRNALLRLIRDRQSRPDQLAYWDDQLLEHGAFLTAQRALCVAVLNDRAQTIHPALTGRQEYLTVTYQSNVLPEEQPIADEAQLETDARRLFAEKLRAEQAREIAQGVSIVGPHRDDLQFTNDGADTTIFGSRGQQRTAALALRLAEAEFIRDRTGEEPIILLDDVMSELDSRRRRQVLSSIRPEQQVIITATDLEDFDTDFLERSHLYRVKAGRVEKTH